MPACGEKFTPVIQCGPLWPEHNEVFLLEAQIAAPGRGVEALASSYDLPCDFVSFVSIFQLPNMTTKGCSFVVLVMYIRCMLIQAVFKPS